MSNQNGITIHVPYPDRERVDIREKTFARLGREALIQGQKEKAKLNGLPDGQLSLTMQERKDILEALRARLEKMGFFSDK